MTDEHRDPNFLTEQIRHGYLPGPIPPAQTLPPPGDKLPLPDRQLRSGRIQLQSVVTISSSLTFRARRLPPPRTQLALGALPRAGAEGEEGQGRGGLECYAEAEAAGDDLGGDWSEIRSFTPVCHLPEDEERVDGGGRTVEEVSLVRLVEVEMAEGGFEDGVVGAGHGRLDFCYGK